MLGKLEIMRFKIKALAQDTETVEINRERPMASTGRWANSPTASQMALCLHEKEDRALSGFGGSEGTHLQMRAPDSHVEFLRVLAWVCIE